MVLSFGLGVSVAINSIIGIPNLRQWSGILDLGEIKLTAHSMKVKFSLNYKLTPQGLPDTVSFTLDDFAQPHQEMANNAAVLLANITITLEIVTEGTKSKIPDTCMVKYMVQNGALECTVDTAHIL